MKAASSFGISAMNDRGRRDASGGAFEKSIRGADEDLWSSTCDEMRDS
jgi:hypothetical protein